MPPEIPPRVACIITSYFPRSHADVIVSKLLADFTHPVPRNLDRFDFHQQVRDLTAAPLPTDAQGNLRRPRLQVASIYTDQVPATDISREWATRASVPIFPSIREALTLGGAELAVDGVLIIGEHGDYPINARGQTEYPRRRLFEEVITVLRECGRAVPIFNTAWTRATASCRAVPALGTTGLLSLSPVRHGSQRGAFRATVGVCPHRLWGHGAQ